MNHIKLKSILKACLTNCAVIAGNVQQVSPLSTYICLTKGCDHPLQASSQDELRCFSNGNYITSVQCYFPLCATVKKALKVFGVDRLYSHCDSDAHLH